MTLRLTESWSVSDLLSRSQPHPLSLEDFQINSTLGEPERGEQCKTLKQRLGNLLHEQHCKQTDARTGGQAHRGIILSELSPLETGVGIGGRIIELSAIASSTKSNCSSREDACMKGWRASNNREENARECFAPSSHLRLESERHKLTP